MKVVIYLLCVLVSSAILTALKASGLYLLFDAPLAGLAAGICTALVYGLGVIVAAPRLIRLWEGRRKKPAAEAPDADEPEEVPPDVPAEVPEEALPVAEPKKELRRRPVRRDVVGYQLAVCILVALLVVVGLKFGSVSGQVDDLQAQVEESYREGYDEGRDEGYAEGLDAGVGSIDIFACFSSGYSAGYDDGRDYTGGIVLPGLGAEIAFKEWLKTQAISFSQWSEIDRAASPEDALAALQKRYGS